MQVISMTKFAIISLSFVILGSCGDSLGPQAAGNGGFHAKYAVARNALEGGDYARASRSYQRLITQAGPLAPRLQLEYAHAELRAGNYGEAARIAGTLAQGQSGAARGAALAVQGTAQHELGLALLAKGEIAPGKAQLTQASAALAEVLKARDDLDPLGSMAGRRASIEARLQKL